jgi:hypothetical protein
VAGVRPSGAEAASAVARSTAARRHQLRSDQRYKEFTEAALAERVVGLPVGPEPGRGGWWLVGRVVDGIAETELEVWCEPVARRIGLREREWGAFPAPQEERIMFDGERRCWIYRDTREAVPASLLEHICRSLRAER